MDKELEVKALEEIIRAHTDSFDLDTLLQNCLEAITKHTNSSMGTLFLYDKSIDCLTVRAEAGKVFGIRFNSIFLQSYDSGLKYGLTKHVFLTKDILVLNSRSEVYSSPHHMGDNDHLRYPEDNNYCGAWIGVPLLGNNNCIIGVVVIENDAFRIPKPEFSSDEIKIIELLAPKVSQAIDKFHNYNKRLSNIINNVQSVLGRDLTLEKKLISIILTFKDVTHADSVSIWLREGNTLKYTVGIGDNNIQNEAKQYKLYPDSYAPDSSNDKLGVTPWVANTGQTIYTRTWKEIINHPAYAGRFRDNDPEKYESLLLAPLLDENKKNIGVISADKFKKSDKLSNYFSEEDAQIFKLSADIASLTVITNREFSLTRRHDIKTLTLYDIGSKCSELSESNDILWHLLIGLTHNDGIGFNRALLFDVSEQTTNIILSGKMAIGPTNIQEGLTIQQQLQGGKLDINLTDSLNRFSRSGFNIPFEGIQMLVEKTRIELFPECPVFSFIKSNEEVIRPLSLYGASTQLQEFMLRINSSLPVVFIIKIGQKERILGFCDYVYTPENEQEPATNYLKLGEVFIKQIELAVARTEVRKASREATEQAWSEFSASTAHRIGTEIAVISGAMYWIKQEGKTNSDYINKIDHSLEKLAESTDDYKRLARFDIIKSKKFNIYKLIEQAKNELNTLDQQKITVELPQSPNLDNIYFVGDNEKLLYTFKELIHNSFKAIHNKAAGHVAIDINLEETKNIIVITISDNGEGIPEQYKDSIFDRGTMYRKDGSGTGLGLYIVKKYIENHGGNIYLIKWTNGTTFRVELPVMRESDVLSKKSILIVEDNEDIGNDLLNAIKQRYSSLKTVKWAKEESEALDLIDTMCFDVMLLDVFLTLTHVPNGINVLKRSSEKLGNRCKVIICSANLLETSKNDNGDILTLRELCESLGAIKLIDKVDINYLIKVLEALDENIFSSSYPC